MTSLELAGAIRQWVLSKPAGFVRGRVAEVLGEWDAWQAENPDLGPDDLEWYPLPPPRERRVSEAEKCAALAAWADAVWPTGADEPVGPKDEPLDAAAAPDGAPVLDGDGKPMLNKVAVWYLHTHRRAETEPVAVAVLRQWLDDLREGGKDKPRAAGGATVPLMPNVEAWTAYYLRGYGLTQQLIAERLIERGYPTSQPSVHRMLKACDEYLKAGGPAPQPKELAASPDPRRAVPMDPATLDMGARQDGCTPRQRPQADDDE